MPDYAIQRANMAASQVLANGVTGERLLAAFRVTPREHFVPPGKRAVAYADAPVEVVPGRWLLAPATLARLLQLAEVTPSDRVLDVGCATGYSTAVLSHIGGLVIGLEQDPELVRGASERLHDMSLSNVSVVHGPLPEGHRAMAPYDAIVVNGGIERVPNRLVAQLAEGGRLVAICRSSLQGHAVLYLKEYGRVGRRVGFDADAPILCGFREPAGFAF